VSITFRCPKCKNDHTLEVPERGITADLSCGATIVLTAEDLKLMLADQISNLSVGFEIIKPRECVHGHTRRTVGCVACALLFPEN